MTIVRVCDIANIRARALGDEVRGHIADDLRYLCIYAQEGVGLEAEAWERLRDTVHALYSVTSAEWHDNADLPGSIAATSEIPTVLLAALGRARIARGLPVTYRQLGALSGISSRTVAKLISDKFLTGHDGVVDAENARRWLNDRNVLGFTPLPAKGEAEK